MQNICERDTTRGGFRESTNIGGMYHMFYIIEAPATRLFTLFTQKYGVSTNEINYNVDRKNYKST